MTLAHVVIFVFLAYASCGLVFALAFVVWGAAQLDPVAKGAGIGFRLLICPASAALWPVLLLKWRHRGNAP